MYCSCILVEAKNLVFSTQWEDLQSSPLPFVVLKLLPECLSALTGHILTSIILLIQNFDNSSLWKVTCGNELPFNNKWEDGFPTHTITVKCGVHPDSGMLMETSM